MSEDSNKIRILIVDDHLGMRDGIRALISTQPDMEVIGEAENGTDAILQYKKLHPDISLIDFNLPIICGADVIAGIRKEFPAARCLVITALTDDGCVRQSVYAGALGFLHKDRLRRELITAIRAIHRGQQYFPEDIMNQLKKYD
jgi:DNA-binding NarL/FixJ family response regulator